MKTERLFEMHPSDAERCRRRLTESYAIGAYLKGVRDNEAEGLKNCNPYIVREFSYVESLLEAIHKEIRRLYNADMERDWFVIEWAPGDYRLFDYETGRLKPIEIKTRDQYEEDINRRMMTTY